VLINNSSPTSKPRSGYHRQMEPPCSTSPTCRPSYRCLVPVTFGHSPLSGLLSSLLINNSSPTSKPHSGYHSQMEPPCSTSPTCRPSYRCLVPVTFGHSPLSGLPSSLSHPQHSPSRGKTNPKRMPSQIPIQTQPLFGPFQCLIHHSISSSHLAPWPIRNHYDSSSSISLDLLHHSCQVRQRRMEKPNILVPILTESIRVLIPLRPVMAGKPHSNPG
jgi:hypothetical protein